MKTHTSHKITTTHTLKDGTEIELELPFKPDCIMDYKDMLVKETADTLTIGYLAHDDDCANPLEDCDGMGAIYECRRHGPTLADYEQALGLADGGPNLDLVDEDAVVERALTQILADADLTETALAHCNEYWDRAERGYDPDPDQDEDFIRNCLDSENELYPIIATDSIRLTLWQEGRAAGTIGDKHAVLLDVHEHGQVSYSVNSGGSADWDTARCGAVWVPDEYAREELLRRAPMYQKGKIEKCRGPGEAYAVYEYRGSAIDSAHTATFSQWHEAFEKLKQAAPQDYLLPMASAERIAARELAAQAATIYTDWRNGNCFGVVVATYSLKGIDVGEMLNDDACWGLIGDDYAYDSLKNDYFPKDPQ